jgi:hypothetical protein
MKSIGLTIASISGAAFFLLLAAGSVPTGPAPNVLSKSVSQQIYTDEDGDPDAGYRVTSIIKNDGQAGKIKVDVTLFCSEGTFDRYRTTSFEAGEVKQLMFDFEEPSWAADDVKYLVEVEAVVEQ